MPPIRTIAKAVDDKVTIPIPREYRSYSFRVVLEPVSYSEQDRKPSLLEALRDCPCDISGIVDTRSEDLPSAFDRTGGFGSKSLPAWAGLCEGSITKNAHGPHDMEAIRNSIASAERVAVS